MISFAKAAEKPRKWTEVLASRAVAKNVEVFVGQLAN